MRKEAKAAGNRREKHWSPSMLIRVEPTDQVLNITLVGQWSGDFLLLWKVRSAITLSSRMSWRGRLRAVRSCNHLPSIGGKGLHKTPGVHCMGMKSERGTGNEKIKYWHKQAVKVHVSDLKMCLPVIVNWPSCQRFTLQFPPDYLQQLMWKSYCEGLTPLSHAHLLIALLCVKTWVRPLATQKIVCKRSVSSPITTITNMKSKEKSLSLSGWEKPKWVKQTHNT